jgi:hypothetical protein
MVFTLESDRIAELVEWSAQHFGSLFNPFPANVTSDI